MNSQHYVPQPGWPIHLSLVLALLSGLLPVKESIAEFMPNLVLLVIVYWALYRPESVGLGWAWLIGLVQDLIMANLIGHHALVYVTVVFLIKYALVKNKNYAFFDYMSWLIAFVILDLLFAIVLNWSVQQISPQWSLVYSVLGSILIWPWLYALLSIVEALAAQIQN